MSFLDDRTRRTSFDDIFSSDMPVGV